MTQVQIQKFKQLDEVGRTSLRVLALNNKYRGKNLLEVASQEGIRLTIIPMHDCASTTARDNGVVSIVLDAALSQSEQRLWFFIELALIHTQSSQPAKLAA
jgi:hypothetical protein